MTSAVTVIATAPAGTRTDLPLAGSPADRQHGGVRTNGTPDWLGAALEEIPGVRVVRDRDELASYETDWTRRFHGQARMACIPRDTAGVAGVLAFCARAGVPVVPQGGNTGLVGGSVPRGGEVVLSTRGLASLSPVDQNAGQVTAGAGVTLERLQQHVRGVGFDFGVDLAARGSATVGGMAATNAGGTRVLRYGSMREQIVGFEAVLPGGGIVSRLGGLPKDNTGYDLGSLLSGSEGTLAVITRLRLRLVPLLASRAVALVGVALPADAVTLAAKLRRACPSLESLEMFHPDGLELVCRHAGMRPPFARDCGAYVVAECAARSDPSEELATALIACPEVAESAMATGRAEREALWAYRERHTESINAEGVPVKLDVAVPVAGVVAFLRAIRGEIDHAAPGARAIIFGHLGEGNFHVNLLGVDTREEAATAAVLRLVAGLGGSISSEHGVGVAKVAYLGLTRSPADQAAMRAIKQALDPAGIMNPGVIFPA